jgi:hypothetical protein
VKRETSPHGLPHPHIHNIVITEAGSRFLPDGLSSASWRQPRAVGGQARD